MKTTLAHSAGLALLLSAGLASAATQLVVPLGRSGPVAKAAGDLPVRFNREGLERLPPGAEVELALPDGSRHDYVFEQTVSHGGGFTTWIASSPLTGSNERAVITYGPHGAWGWMKTRHGSYRIYPSGNGYDLVAKREPRSFAPNFKGGDAIRVGNDEPGIEAFKGIPTVVSGPLLKSFTTKVTPTPTLQSDVMFLYTRDLAEKLGVGLMPMLYNQIASLNQAYVDSEVAITVRLVNATMIDYANANSGNNGSSATLNAMRGSGGNAAFFESLTWGASSLRNAVGADFVALLRDGPNDTGGIAGLLFNAVTYPASTATQTQAYSVNNFCASGCEEILAHEIGHNMGNHHDPATIAQDSGTGTVDETGVFAYSYGYYNCAGALTCNPYTTGAGACTNYAECSGTNANDFGSIMSYFHPRVMKFSNPGLSNCVPAGGAAGSPRVCGGTLPAPAPPAVTTNNALSMNNVRGALSAYRTQTLTNIPGSVQFSNTGYSGPEGGNLTFTVSRSGGSSGSVTVNYAVTAGSATAGTDYTAASGTLTWIAGDTANKTFNVALATDALVEGVETIIATLSTPTGAPGVFIGYPAVATGLILEAWPIGTLGGIPTDPAGWVSPSSPTVSSVPWAIVNDSAPVGDPGGRSLKSGLINFAGAKNCTELGSVPCPSVVEITRDFAAGTVAYAYRVSAYPGFGFLEFLVDGVAVHSVTGTSANTAADTGWLFFSTTISAGNHTLQWRYRPRLSFACANAISSGPGPDFPGCLDRAWIDQLALPPANSAPPNPPRLGNISTRMQVLTGNDVMIGGFVIGGSANKTVVVRARGPSLIPFGITNALANPSLQLVRSSDQVTLATNDDFGTAANLVALNASGFAPGNPLEAAILSSLPPGAYTAIVSGVANGTGVGIVEVFEVDGPAIPLANISTRGRVLTGNDVMIGGFVVQGTGPQTVVVRARGPSLIPFGITNALPDPTLQLVRSSDQVTLATNDNWQSATNAAAITSSGFAPSNNLESAILMSLPPGAYTAIVSGVGGGTGVGIVEVFTTP